MSGPRTLVRTSHVLVLRARGRNIGAVHNYAVSMRRPVEDRFEVNAQGYGMPVDTTPKNIEGREIRLGRYDLYTAIMEEVFGTTEWTCLCDQSGPFDLIERWSDPGLSLGGLVNATPLVPGSARGALSNVNVDPNIAGAIAAATSFLTTSSRGRGYAYVGCYFTDLGRTIDAKGDRTINVEATINYRDKVKL